MKESFSVFVPPIIIVGLVASIVGFCIYNMHMYELKTEYTRDHSKFQVGEMIITTVGHIKGQVINKWCNVDRCYYDVRLSQPQSKTDTRVLSDDGAISSTPIGLIENMREFELEKYNESR